MMHPQKHPVAFLAGPMTGLPEYNYPAFHQAAARLWAAGYSVINPAENFDGDTSLPRETYIRRAVGQVASADVIAVLPYWECSPGARLEVAIARQCGMPVIVADPTLPLFELIGAVVDTVLTTEIEPLPDAAVAAAIDPAQSGGEWTMLAVPAVPSVAQDAAEARHAPESILEEAARIVTGPRQRDYDHPRENFRRIGELWGVLLEPYVQQCVQAARDSMDVLSSAERAAYFKLLKQLKGRSAPVPNRMVGQLMIAVKLARDCFTEKRDNLVDIAGCAGYADCTDRATQPR